MSSSLLAANRIDEILVEDYPVAEQWSEGIGSMLIRNHVHYHASGKEVVVRKETIVKNQRQAVIREELEDWNYESIHAPPLEHLKEIKARLWLPGRSRRGGLNRVELQRTAFWWESIYAQRSGQLSYRRLREGEVVYRTAPIFRTLSSGQKTRLEDQGRETDVAFGPLQIIIESAMTWDQAIGQSAIVEEEDVSSTSIWRELEVTEHRVEETWALIMSYTIRKDLLHPGVAEVDGPHYQKKTGVVFQLPVPLNPPEIAATANAASITVEVAGGGAVLNVSWPKGTSIPIRVEKYRIYRRVVSRPSRSIPADRFDTWETPPAASARFDAPIDEVTVTDVAGAGASSLPAPGADTEPEDPAPPDVDYWSMIKEVANAEADKRGKGQASFIDTDVETGAVYEYRATCLVAEQESEPSQEVRISYGGTTGAAGSRISVTTDPETGVVEIDVTAAEDVEVLDLLADGTEEYGETVIFDIPIELSEVTDQGEDGGVSPEDLGKEIEQAQMTRNQGLRRMQVTPTVPILGIRRGQLIKPPVTGWKTYGNDRIITSENEQRLLRVDGWGLRVAATVDGFELATNPLECLEVRS